MTVYAIVRNGDNFCVGSSSDRTAAEEQCEVHNARVVELSDSDGSDLHCKYIIDGQLITNTEMLHDIAAEDVRFLRDRILEQIVDPIVTNIARYNELTEERKQEWLRFRTDLLNVPEQEGFPDNVEWPVAPNNQQYIQE